MTRLKTESSENSASGAAMRSSAMRQGRIETLVGLCVALGLIVLMALAIVGRHTKKDDGYPLRARFSHIDGLEVGSDIRLAGVTIGHVTQTQINPQTYQAQVTFSVMPSVKLPTDSGAVITSDSLLGGKYIALSPGGAGEMLKPGDVMGDTQGAISLEQLLSKFIFTVTDSLQKQNKDRISPSDESTPKGSAPKGSDL